MYIMDICSLEISWSPNSMIRNVFIFIMVMVWHMNKQVLQPVTYVMKLVILYKCKYFLGANSEVLVLVTCQQFLGK